MTQSADSSLVLLIPAYNEEERIGPVLRRYAEYFRANYAGRFEIVVVLNGCRDNTLGVVEAAAAEFPEIRALEYVNPIGKGGALIEGLKLAPTADLIGYVDADGATPPEAFLDLVRHCKRVDCAIGSRWLPESQIEQVQSLKRRIFSRVFHMYVELLFGMRIADTQCGAKLFRLTPAIRKIFEKPFISAWIFDVELIARYVQAHGRDAAARAVYELPIMEWHDVPGSKVRAMDFLRALNDLRKIHGAYRR